MGSNPALPIPSFAAAAHGGHLQRPSVHSVLLAAGTYGNAIITDHAASQMARRGNSEEAVQSVLRSPAQVERAAWTARAPVQARDADRDLRAEGVR